jgi:Na+/phosphate symporter
VTLVRLAVVVLLVLSGLVVFYGLILDRTGQNVAFTVAGLLVFGLCMVFTSAWFLGRAMTDARRGRTSGAILGSLAGGICAIGAAGSLAAASVFAIITGL